MDSLSNNPVSSPRSPGDSVERKALELCDKEKERIGRDLHDSIGQQLTGISLLSKASEHRLRKSGHPDADSLMKISELVDETINQVRAVLAGLAPVEIHNRDAGTALRILCRRIEQTHQIRCTFNNQLTCSLSNPEIVKNLYFVAAEAINNAIRHSQANQIEVRLRNGNHARQGELMIRSNSTCSTIDAFSELTGIGLTGMHFRAEVMKGTLDILRYPDDFIAIICSFELPDSVYQ